MEVTTFINDYNHKKLKCPFCGYACYWRDATKISPDVLRDLKRHIKNQAKNEAFEMVFQEGMETPHLKYFKEHSQEVAVVPKSRRLDNDLKLHE